MLICLKSLQTTFKRLVVDSKYLFFYIGTNFIFILNNVELMSYET